jgi:oxygen-independent coproporphyrinogen-3 oxidase
MPADTLTLKHIYVHIPFCARICPYCAFYKELLDRSQTDRFCEALVLELQQYRQQHELAPLSVYFGGGTPTALTTAQLDRLLTGFRESLDLQGMAEWTMEANPGSVSPRKAELLRAGGVDRISLGVQSWDDDLLQLLGREHNSKQAEESFRIFRAAGFPNLNIDLMFALPGQTATQWQSTLEKTIALGPDHVSTYCLTYEEDTDFFLRHSRGEFRSDNDAEARLFEMTMSTLQSAGYQQYEISNYARPGFESVHNRGYWAGADYLGVGPSAFSTIDLKRWQNVANYRDYADRVFASQSPIDSVEDLSAGTKNTERIALGLRTREGIAANLLQHRPNETADFIKLGLLERQNDNFVLTERGKCLADSVAEAFV